MSIISWKYLKGNTYGIPNWIIVGVPLIGGLSLMAQGFTGTNTEGIFSGHCDTIQIKGPIPPEFTGAFYAVQSTPLISSTYCCNKNRVFSDPNLGQVCCATNLVSSGGISYCPGSAMDNTGKVVTPKFPTSSTTTPKPLGNTPVTGPFPNLPSMRSVVGMVTVA